MKRSSQVALLLMGVTGVGATGYAMTKPPANCVPQGPAAMAPARPGMPAAEPCPQRRSWSSTGYGYRSSWTRTNNSGTGSAWPIFSRRSGTSATASTSVPLSGRTSTSTSTSTSRASTTTTQRSGFGSTASSHSSGS